ncbi:hypothetical protein [Streptomyces kebangsaanensis]|uniref:hypothetical protein n=1 Tax=Streptomyces kebangsaanensis TaxID=864058 RepID=UPI0009402A78|nr:hypothetical protein [Streptomyces kebangsaanensis]
MVTALATAVLSVTAALLLLLTLLLTRHGRKTTAQVIRLLPKPLDAFLSRVGRRVMLLWKLGLSGGARQRCSVADRKDRRVGARLRLISVFLPKEEKWRLEETMNHRNELRENGGRLPRFYYLVSFVGACRMRGEAWTNPKRRVD